MKQWTVIILLSLAQFIMVLDSTVMNVSISALVADLNTTVSGVQMAITFYTLTMAALMLTGGKLGEKWGSKKALIIGALIYGLGSFITAISQNLPTLLVGWSVIEGIGAILVIPAIASLIVANYTGKQRALAYGILGAVAGAGAAVGPLIGGFATTYFSWRYVFLAETIAIICILFFINQIKADQPKKSVSIDIPSLLLSATGMTALVFGILQSKVWGWVQPKAIPVIAGYEVAPLGFSLVIYLLVLGAGLLWQFYRRQQMLRDQDLPQFLDIDLFQRKNFTAGTSTLLVQYLITAGAFFVFPVYLQMLLGLDALQTGVRMMPLSIGLVLFAVLGAKLTSRYSARQLARAGFAAVGGGLIVMMAAMDIAIGNPVFMTGMFVFGVGLGLLSSQLGNVILSAVPAKAASQAGGVQGTFQNLGSSLGTAIIGSVLIASLTTNFSSLIANSTLSSSVQTSIAEATSKGVPIIAVSELETALSESSLSSAEVQSIVTSYQDAQLQALKTSLLFLSIVLLVSIPLTKNLPLALQGTGETT